MLRAVAPQASRRRAPVQQAATNGGSQTPSSATVNYVEPSAAQPSTARPVSCRSAVRSPSPCCAARLLFRRVSECVAASVSSARFVCDLLPPARHNQIPTVKPLTVGLSRTKKFSNFFQSILARHVANSVPRPCAPCNPSARAYPAPWTTHGGGRTARARGGSSHTVQGDIVSYTSTIVPYMYHSSKKSRTRPILAN